MASLVRAADVEEGQGTGPTRSGTRCREQLEKILHGGAFFGALEEMDLGPEEVGCVGGGQSCRIGHSIRGRDSTDGSSTGATTHCGRTFGGVHHHLESGQNGRC